MGRLEKIFHHINKVLLFLAGCFLIGLIMLTCANVILRLLWKPLMGTFELIRYSVAIVTALALGYTQLREGYVAVDILVLKFSAKTRKMLNAINSLTCMIFFMIVTWQIAKYATKLLKTGEVTETLEIIYYPFTYGAALGCAFLCLAFLVDFLKSIYQK